MRYRIRYTDEARRALRKMPGDYRQRTRRLVKALADDPRPLETKELRGLPGRFRIRLNRWRIIYRVDDEDQMILVLHVRPKRGPETYEDLPSSL
ncbi:MAG: type II toxin-antitoxin system RelE/ParE family toxin [Candidatus Bipolaricaulia bacterium]